MSDATTPQNVQDVITMDAGFICSACLAPQAMADLVTHDEEIYCQDCFDKRYYTCSDCGSVDTLPVSETVDGDDYCQDCFDETFTSCDRCNAACTRDSTTSVRHGYRSTEDWCEDCTRGQASQCRDCEEYVPDDDAIGTGYVCLCMSCYEDGYFTCIGCENVCSNDDYARDGYCEDCWKERGLGKIQRLLDRLDDPKIRAVRVSREDSLDAGNCSCGTDEFIDEYFPHLYEWACVTIGQIVDAVCPNGIEDLADHNAEYAKQIGLACLHAARRSNFNV